MISADEIAQSLLSTFSVRTRFCERDDHRKSTIDIEGMALIFRLKPEGAQ